MDSADLGLLLSVYGLQATGAIRAKFMWDAENRLVGWEPLLFVSGARKCEFAYDYMGRRIEKKVYTYDGESWSLSQTRRFVWNTAAGGSSGWLLLLELDGDNVAQRKLTWGRDLGSVGVPAGNSLASAGGVGGLLAVQDANGTTTGENHESDDLRYVYFYDANGNVGQVIDPAASSAGTSIKAHYEYDAYGNVLVQSGSYATANPYRFSTKPWDDETGLGYWGQRYYDPRLGRWINHDPIGELGGLNLYAYVSNDPIGAVDPVGRLSLAGPWTWEPCPQSAPASGPASAPTTQSTQPASQPTYVKCTDSSGADRDCGETVCKKHCDSHPDVGGSTLCDGNGGVCCCVCPDNIDKKKDDLGVPDDDLRGVYKKCQGHHEGQHVDDYTKDPNFKDCDGKPAGEEIPARPDSECRAYEAELTCIANNVPKDCWKTPKCQEQVKKLMAARLTGCLRQCKDEEKCKKLIRDALKTIIDRSKEK